MRDQFSDMPSMCGKVAEAVDVATSFVSVVAVGR